MERKNPNKHLDISLFHLYMAKIIAFVLLLITAMSNAAYPSLLASLFTAK